MQLISDVSAISMLREHVLFGYVLMTSTGYWLVVGQKLSNFQKREIEKKIK